MYPQVFGKYVLERELSRGGMARVVLATLRGAGGFEKKLVVKQIRDELAFDQQFVRRFVEEAKTTVALSHPNIVPVYELGIEQGTYFLAMELVEGVSVAELLREREDDGARRVLTPEEGAYLGVEVCRALDYAHRRMKVVHRDITPRNVMIDEEGQIKLIDFGIAAPALVAGHEILGSPGHMAPEQVDGGELGPPTDIFAVAVLLMEAWTGSAPFRRATPEECAIAVREPHPKPSDFNPRLLPLDAAIARAMHVDARARQQEASDLARALRSFIQGVDVADIARELGDRVRDLREEAASPSPPSRITAPRASAASHGDLGTKTFAARDEALKWSSPPGPVEGDDGLPAPSTRRLEESTPKLPASQPVRGRPDNPAMGIRTPLMVDVDELERSTATSRRRERTSAPSVHRRTGQHAPRRSSRRSRPCAGASSRARTARRPRSSRRSRLGRSRPPCVRSRAPRCPRRPRGAVESFAAAGLLALVAIGGFAAWRARGGPPVDPPRPATTTATTTTAVIEPKGAPTTASSDLAPPEAVVSAPSPVRTVPSSTAPTTPSAAPVAAGKAAVTFLGEPGTRVSIDGASRGPCPVRVTLAEGPHEVRFTFESHRREPRRALQCEERRSGNRARRVHRRDAHGEDPALRAQSPNS